MDMSSAMARGNRHQHNGIRVNGVNGKAWKVSKDQDRGKIQHATANEVDCLGPLLASKYMRYVWLSSATRTFMQGAYWYMEASNINTYQCSLSFVYQRLRSRRGRGAWL